MAKTKTKERKLKRLYNQLKAHDLQSSTRIARHPDMEGKEILTRKGKIEVAIHCLEKPKK